MFKRVYNNALSMKAQSIVFHRPDEESFSSEEHLRRELSEARHKIRMLTKKLETIDPDSARNIDLEIEFKWTDVEEMVIDFDGENCKAETWVNHVRKIIRKYRLEEEEAKSLVHHKLKGNAHSWYYSMPNYKDMTSEEVLLKLCRKF